MRNRICNLNSFSAVIDRLIIEHLKLLRFVENNDDDKVKCQEEIIDGLKMELEDIFSELCRGSYKSVDENRTYESKSNDLIDGVFKLCVCNHIIGKMDKKKIRSAEKNLNPRSMRGYILQVRDYLEFRAYIKNKLENNIK